MSVALNTLLGSIDMNSVQVSRVDLEWNHRGMNR